MADHLTGLVEDLDVNKIRDGAVRLLAEVGMSVPAEPIRRRLAGAGIKVADGRACFDPERTRAFMDRQRAGASPEPGNLPIRLHTGSHCLYHYDAADRKVKRLTMEAVEMGTRLVAALHQKGVLASACAIGSPADVEPQLTLLWQHFVTARFIKEPALYAYAAQELPFVIEMAKVLNRKVSGGVHPISPLTLGGEEFELAIKLLDEGMQDYFGCAPMPVMGVTAPLDWTAGWAQAVAEAVGTALAMVALGAKGASAFAALYAADMRTAGLVFGSPEHVLCTLTEAKVNREVLGNRRRAAKAFNSTAKEPGAQAAAERMAHVVAALLAGYRELGSAGVLAVDEIFSAQQLFIDFEIVGHALRIVQGLDPPQGNEDIVSLVRDGLSQSEHFMTAPATLDRFRDFYWSPKLFDRRPTGAWLAHHTDALDQAWEMAREAIAGYDYELDDGRQRALRAVIADARQRLVLGI